MMEDADRTWALIVGVDDYPSPIPKLTGAVEDAVAFTQLMLSYGVPAHNILLHVSPRPDSQQSLNALTGIPHRPATQNEIQNAAFHIGGLSGRRLVVYLAGHGVFLPDEGRVFLTADFLPGYRNIGVEHYIRYFLSCDFMDQFLFMDGCLNSPLGEASRYPYQAGIVGGHKSIPNPQNCMASLMAASQGQVALENPQTRRGVMTRHLLDALDMTNPASSKGMEFDFFTGEWRINLQKVAEYVRLQVQKEVPDQTPKFTPDEGNGMRSEVYLCTWNMPGLNWNVELDVQPPTNVALIGLQTTHDPFLTCVLPQSPRTLELPVQIKIPDQSELDVSPYLRDKHLWQLEPVSPHRIMVTGDTRLKFSCLPILMPFSTVQVGLQDHQGTPNPLGLQTFLELQDRLGHHDMQVMHSLTGAEVTVNPQKWSESMEHLERVANALNKVTPSHLKSVVQSDQVALVDVHFPEGGPTLLAGPVTSEAQLRAFRAGRPEDQKTFPLRSFGKGRIIALPPGRWTFALTLPWGEWQETLDLKARINTGLPLPSSVGIPPLRIKLHQQLQQQPKDPVTLVFDGPPQPWKAIRKDALLKFRLMGSTSEASLLDQSQWIDMGRGQERVRFPLPITREGWGEWRTYPMLVSWSSTINPEAAGAAAPKLRVEPYINTTHMLWDALVASANLEVLTDEHIETLLYAKWDEPLLGLAGAYALQKIVNTPRVAKVTRRFSDGRSSPLLKVVRNLRDAGISCVDVDLLEASITSEWSGLQKWASVVAVPYYRWGLELLPSRIASMPPAPLRNWMLFLHRVRGHLASTGAWTVWRPTRLPRYPTLRQN